MPRNPNPSVFPPPRQTLRPSPRGNHTCTLVPRIAHCGWISEHLAAHFGAAAGDAGAELPVATSIHLSNMEYCSIPQLGSCTNLVWLNLSGNLLTNVPGLESCSKLVELNLADNLLANVSCVRGCVALRRLDLGRNQLKSLDMLGPMPVLVELTVDNNALWVPRCQQPVLAASPAAPLTVLGDHRHPKCRPLPSDSPCCPLTRP